MDRIAVIGLGNIATRHRRNIRTLYPNAFIYSLSSTGRKVEGSITDSDLNVESIEELINLDVDMAIVASPATLHCEHAIPLINAGVPVLIEKPIGTSCAHLSDLSAAIKAKNAKVAVGYCLRYLPSAQKVKSIFDDEMLGEIYNVNIEIGQYLPYWRPNKDYRDSVSARVELGGGALLELSHEMDYAQWLFGKLHLQHAILRKSSELKINVECLVDILATTDQGAVVSIHQDFMQKKAWRQCNVIGSKGRVCWDLIRNEVSFIDSEKTELLYSLPEWDKNLMYIHMIEDFVRYIKNEPCSCVSVTSAIETIKFINEIKSKY